MRIGWPAGAIALALAAVPLAGSAANGPGLEAQLGANAEKLPLSGRKGPSLLRPGFAVGEYTGSAKMVSRKVKASGVFSSDKASASLDLQRPGLEPVTAACGGGQGRLGLGWITFKRDELGYVCTYGGSAPAGAEFNLVESDGKGGGFMNKLSQPQRAAELRYGSVRLRAETRLIGGFPISGGGAVSYAIFRPDGTVIGGMSKGGLRPVFYFPRQPGPERDAVAIMALTLFAFQDPGKD